MSPFMLLLAVATTPADAYEGLEGAGGSGVLTGKITTSQPASTEKLPVTQDGEVCGESVAAEFVLVKDGNLQNAVVFLDGIEKGAPITKSKATLDQKGCVYTPHVQAMAKGSSVSVMNSDAVMHNTHAGTSFNFGMPAGTPPTPKSMRRPGLVPVNCDAGHTWMSAYIYVFSHPYFATTGADGTYKIEGVPDGAHKLTVWHEKLGTKTVDITVEGGEVTTDIQLD